MSTTIHFATTNAGKVQDAQEILADTGYAVEQLDVDTVEPSLDDITEIAAAKVRQAWEHHGADGLLLADDSGLFVDALGGFPGPQTAFFDRTVGKEKLLRLVDADRPAASFRAAIAVLDPDTLDTETFTGRCNGVLVPPRGDGGFGYDPMFLPDGHDRTFAEDPDHKHRVSHRREALKAVQVWLEGR